MKAKTPPESLLEHYTAMVETGKLTPDPNQLSAIETLSVLEEALSVAKDQEHNPGLLQRFGWGKHKAICPIDTNGVYMYGSVGRGKSMLMDMFYSSVPRKRKWRMHFHAFMQYIHQEIHTYRQEKGKEAKDPLPVIASRIAEKAILLCLDELQVTDIGDAMIISGLFNALFEEGIIVVITSNRPPKDLYLHGLQRERFLPFIDLVHERMGVIRLDGTEDYRLKKLSGMKQTYLTPDSKQNRKLLEELFADLSFNAKPQATTLDVHGRQLTFEHTAGDILFTDFATLCEKPLGPGDYLEIARHFGTVLIASIPQLGKEKRNQAKRFVTLIDALYEHKVKLLCTAETTPEKLYPAGEGAFEFERTVSRLIEMQSADYMKTEHNCS